MDKALHFRNMLAEDGIELTPKEAEKVTWIYESLTEYVRQQLAEDPYFPLKLEDETTEQKLGNIKELEEEFGMKMGLREYNELKEVMLAMCELEEM